MSAWTIDMAGTMPIMIVSHEAAMNEIKTCSIKNGEYRLKHSTGETYT